MIDVEKLDVEYRKELLRNINTYVRKCVLECPDKTLKNRYTRLIEEGKYFISISYLRSIDYSISEELSKYENLEDQDIVCGCALFEPIPGKGGTGIILIGSFVYDLTEGRPEEEMIRHCKIIMQKNFNLGQNGNRGTWVY